MKNRHIENMLGILFFFVTLLLFFPETSHSSPDIPDDNLSYPVLLVSKGGGTGSGFYYNKEDSTYLITARHVLFKETTLPVSKFIIPKSLRHKLVLGKGTLKDEFILTFYGVMSQNDKDMLMGAAPAQSTFNFKEAFEKLYKDSQELKLRSDKIKLFSNGSKVSGGKGINELEVDMRKLLKSGLIKYHPSQDVAYLKIGKPIKVSEQRKIAFFEGVISKQVVGLLGLDKDNFKLIKDVVVGNKVFVFGYPTSITKISPWLDINSPLLREGIIAGKNNELKAIILDCPVYYGNSGGLVIEVENTSFNKIAYRAIGIITNLVPFQGPWLQNSGYSIVVPMDFVEELITNGESG